ncbi:MAG: retroviral-like aspartic protease family protein [Myxacorys californica WJT36-NPBG1]|jgi:predicted aspartyl protease|nr:retroviral-like aspartic protease family protein [Myxacorys californica WJT36-NPBG1]
MPKSFRAGTLLLAIAGVFALSNLACSQVHSAKVKPPQAKPTVPEKTPAPQETPQDESYRLAMDRADSAKSITESAQSPEDWELVIGRWRDAIALLKQVPNADPNKKFAIQKLREYQRNLVVAERRARGMGKENIKVIDPGFSIDPPISKAESAPSYSEGDNVYRVKIKYRKNRIPVIDVVFNGSQRYEMMVDTGASSTMINEEMAERLGVKVVGTTKAQTAAGVANVQIGFLRSIAVGNNTIVDVPVSIGPLDIGLLGHDLFGDCDLSIKRDVVEFAQCQKNK